MKITPDLDITAAQWQLVDSGDQSQQHNSSINSLDETSHIIVVSDKSPSAEKLLISFLELLDADTSSGIVDSRYTSGVNGRRYIIHPTHVFTDDEDSSAFQLMKAALTRRLADSANILVFLMDTPTISSPMRQYYDILYKVACNSAVPAILLCSVPPYNEPEHWWSRARPNFHTQYGMEFMAFSVLQNDYSHLEMVQQRAVIKSLIMQHQCTSSYRISQPSFDPLTIFEQKCSDFWKDIVTPGTPEYDDKFFEDLKAHEKESNCLSSLLSVNGPSGTSRYEPGKKNIVVFGQTGTGKSSVINLLLGGERANVGDDAQGVTDELRCFKKRIGGEVFNVWDTPGLGENNHGKVTPANALRQLYTLVTGQENGIHLLLFVFEGRITQETSQIYKIVHDYLCGERVPIVIVVTGLEGDPTNNVWWDNNKQAFERDNMIFSDAACVVANASQQWRLPYERSRESVANLIRNSAPNDGWTPETYGGVAQFFNQVLSVITRRRTGFNRALYAELKTYLKDEARDATLGIAMELSRIKDINPPWFSWLKW